MLSGSSRAAAIREAGMMQTRLAGHAQTVLGPVAPETLGITMTHEHLLVDLRSIFDEPARPILCFA